MAHKNISDSGRRGGGAAPGGRLYKRVADELRAAILAGRYAPGRRLPAERELGEMFNVSRPTVREAVIALELQGLVEVRVGAGVFVLEPSAAERVRGGGPELTIGPFELMEARKIIESETAALAATLIDDEQLERAYDVLGEVLHKKKSRDRTELEWSFIRRLTERIRDYEAPEDDSSLENWE